MNPPRTETSQAVRGLKEVPAMTTDNVTPIKPPDWNGLEDRRAPNQITARAIQDAVAQGIQAAVSDPETWNKAGQAMRQQAEAHAGGWLMAGIKAAFTKLAWVSVIFLGVYMLGGWGAVVSLLKGQGIGKP